LFGSRARPGRFGWRSKLVSGRPPLAAGRRTTRNYTKLHEVEGVRRAYGWPKRTYGQRPPLLICASRASLLARLMLAATVPAAVSSCLPGVRIRVVGSAYQPALALQVALRLR
jgi:hypothetical protein